MLLALVLVAGWQSASRLYDFLAPTHAVGGKVLVVEGWLSDDDLVQAVDRMRQGGYRILVTTGGPLVQGSFLSEYKSYAQLSLASLHSIAPEIPAHAVPAGRVTRDRTYHSALAVKAWLAAQDPDIRSLDLITAGPHARRSQLLYRKAFGEGFDIGIIALAPANYDASRWWGSSAGVRTVIGESIAWLYAVLVFSPPAPTKGQGV